MRKERLIGTLCSAISGVYISSYTKEKNKEDLIFGIVYFALSVGWVIVDARNSGREEAE